MWETKATLQVNVERCLHVFYALHDQICFLMQHHQAWLLDQNEFIKLPQSPDLDIKESDWDHVKRQVSF